MRIIKVSILALAPTQRRLAEEADRQAECLLVTEKLVLFNFTVHFRESP